MHFTKVELHNFGIYKGTHEMVLRDSTHNQNITLIGGFNGRGKTTFHDGVLLALYGKQARTYIQERARSYDKLLIDHINKDALQKEAYVAVTLVLEDGITLRVKRAWKQGGVKLEHSLVVEKNGIADKYLASNWDYYIEEILPFGIARFFFFNNEKITQLADDTSFEQIKASIKSAIGVSTIEKVIKHLESVIRTKQEAIQQFEYSGSSLQLRSYERDIKSVEEELTQARIRLQEFEKELEKVTAEYDLKESEFWSTGGNLVRNRDAMNREREQLQNEVKEKRQKMQQMASSPSTPLALCQSLVVEAYNHEHNQIASDLQYLTEDALSIIFQRLMNRFNQADLESDTLDKIKDILRSEMKDHMESDKKPSHISASPASQMLYQHLITELFPSLTEKIKALIHTTKVQESTFLTLDSQLDADDAQEIAKQIHAALQSIAERKSLAQSNCRQQKETIRGLELKKSQLSASRMKLIKSITQKADAYDDDVRVLKYATMSIEAFQKFKTRLQREKVQRLSEAATKCFKNLVQKESLIDRIQIDADTLNVTIIDVDGKELLKSQLSAGEQQMFAVAIVWSLALSSGYKAPVMVDTPMARLDSSHRTNFVTRYLPSASSQVIVLSTDEEINGRYLDMIRDHVIDYYTLLYSEENRCTSIVPGYFQEAKQ